MSVLIVAGALAACTAAETKPIESEPSIVDTRTVEPPEEVDRGPEPGDEVDSTPADASVRIPEDELSVALQPWKGDYRDMVDRRRVRILVPYSLTHFFLDGATKRGTIAAAGRELEEEINRREQLRTLRVRVVFIPTPRDQLIPWLLEGIGDIAAGGLTITEARRAVVDFSTPVLRDSKEIVCTAPGVPPVNAIEDLAGAQVYVQASSSYRESLMALNDVFAKRGLPPIEIVAVREPIEADEMLEMVQAGLFPRTVVDQHLAEFWAQMFPDLRVYPDVVVAAERDIAWAFRKDSPQLEELLEGFISARRYRTKFGNQIFKRYLQRTDWVRGYQNTAGWARVEALRPLFEKYAQMYDLDPLLLISLAYKESRLNQDVRSRVGAIGVMQIMPSTGDSLKVGDITQLEPNIHGGAKYVRRLMNTVKEPEVTELNRIFFALASYNGGQGRIRRLRRETADRGLDPNVWFDNVEIAVARVIGRETVQYVGSIYRLYLALRMAEDRRLERTDRARSLR